MRLNRGFSRTTFISVCASESPNETKLSHGSGRRKWQRVEITRAKIDIEYTAQWGRWLHRLVRPGNAQIHPKCANGERGPKASFPSLARRQPIGAIRVC